MRSLILALLLSLVANPALAADGVLEINQTCAVQTGCFPGDGAGFPVTIALTGSYRLTSNLRRTLGLGQNGNYIDVLADDVSIDLGGFSISCDNGFGDGCTGKGSGIAVANVLNVEGTSVRNGSISGMAENGVTLGRQSEATGLRVRRNGDRGISVNGGSVVYGNLAFENDIGLHGGGGGALFKANTVFNNVTYGLILHASDTYRENVIIDNGHPFGAIGTNRGDNSCSGPGTVSAFCP
jgi:hypothetical protein